MYRQTIEPELALDSYTFVGSDGEKVRMLGTILKTFPNSIFTVTSDMEEGDIQMPMFNGEEIKIAYRHMVLKPVPKDADLVTLSIMLKAGILETLVNYHSRNKVTYLIKIKPRVHVVPSDDNLVMRLFGTNDLTEGNLEYATLVAKVRHPDVSFTLCPDRVQVSFPKEREIDV